MGMNAEHLTEQQSHVHTENLFQTDGARIEWSASWNLTEIVWQSALWLTSMMNWHLEKTQEANDTHILFGLSEQEKSSIEADIMAKKLISDTPAYRKFLKIIFPDNETNFPYRVNYEDSLVIVSQLTLLFWRSVRLPNEDDVRQSLKENSYFTGNQFTLFPRPKDAGGYCCAWLFGGARGEFAPCAWWNRNGNWNSIMNYSRGSNSVIPVFE